MSKTQLRPQTDDKQEDVDNDELPAESDEFRMSPWPQKEERAPMWAKWRICSNFPFISSRLTGAGGGGQPKSALMCSEALANHTWPLPPTLANEWRPLGAICCRKKVSYSPCRSSKTRTQAHLCEDIQDPCKFMMIITTNVTAACIVAAKSIKNTFTFIFFSLISYKRQQSLNSTEHKLLNWSDMNREHRCPADLLTAHDFANI